MLTTADLIKQQLQLSISRVDLYSHKMTQKGRSCYTQKIFSPNFFGIKLSEIKKFIIFHFLLRPFIIFLRKLSHPRR
jgi:hypothetical protein